MKVYFVAIIKGSSDVVNMIKLGLPAGAICWAFSIIK